MVKPANPLTNAADIFDGVTTHICVRGPALPIRSARALPSHHARPFRARKLFPALRFFATGADAVTIPVLTTSRAVRCGGRLGMLTPQLEIPSAAAAAAVADTFALGPPAAPTAIQTVRALHLINGEHYSGAERVQDLLARSCRSSATTSASPA